MAGKKNPRRLAIEQRIRQLFELNDDESKLLADDILINIETVKKDLISGVKNKSWKLVLDASQALEALGANLEQDDLIQTAQALREAADAKRADVGPIVKDLDAFLSGLTGGDPDVPNPVLDEDEDEIPDESDNNVFIVDSTDDS